MTVQQINTTTEKPADRKGILTGGVILITIGLGLLLFKWIALEMYFPLLLGLIFVMAGIVNRNAGFMIPGGIVGGVGLGVLAVESGWFAAQGTQESGGMFLLAMSIGWFAIILLTKLFTSETQVWPVFPGAAMALIGGLILLGESGLHILEMLGTYWPLILVAVGLSLLYKWWKSAR
jgi:hypothetical protein